MQSLNEKIRILTENNKRHCNEEGDKKRRIKATTYSEH